MSLTQPELDAAVIAAARTGDRHAHEAIYRHYADRLFTLIYRLVSRRAQAEDLLHEVFMDVLRRIDTYAGIGPFGAWLRAIAVNKCLAHLRSPWSRGRLWLDEALHAETEPAEELGLDHAVASQRDLATALRQLTPLARAVVWLHDVEGYTHAEIARFVGRTTSFSKSQLARAHARLRTLLNVDSTDIATLRTSSCTTVTPSL